MSLRRPKSSDSTPKPAIQRSQPQELTYVTWGLFVFRNADTSHRTRTIGEDLASPHGKGPIVKTAASLRLVAGAVVALGAIVAPALAQNALGNGTGLDNNLSVNGTTNTRVRDLQAEIAFRNAIVTGNAANFQSFRGEVGYTAAGEFRGILGSDELFPFRRDSLTSGLAGLGIRGTEALQYSFALSTGGTPPDGLAGGFSLGRGGYSVEAAGASTNRSVARRNGFEASAPEIQGLARRPLEAEFSERGTLLGTLRSPAAYSSNRGLSQVFLGRFEANEAGVVGLTASELRAVRAAPLVVDADFGRIGVDDNGDEADPMDSRRETQVAGGQVEANARDTSRPAAEVGTAHAQLLERIAGSEDDEPSASPRARLEELRRRLNAPPQFDFGPDQEGDEGQEEGETGEAGDAGAEAGTVSGRERALRDQIARLDPELVEAMGGGERVRGLISEQRGQPSVYTRHVQAGEQLLARERYFDAEERFAQALSINRGDVTAQIGRVHAQLGAGLYVSAAVNLRSLFVEHPEVVGARYDETLLPVPRRLATLRRDLERVSSEQGASRVGLAAALLLAYLGYQAEEPEVVRRAFSVLDQTEGLADVTDARLAILLRRVWLDAEAPTNDAEPGG